jgi:hypothetical protein
MSRSRDKILENLDEMYREAFERARATGDAAQMASLDFAYRRSNSTSRSCSTCATRWSAGRDTRRAPRGSRRAPRARRRRRGARRLTTTTAAVSAGPVTLAVVNARAWTGVARRPWADAVAVRGDRLALVGGSAEARKLAAAAPGARVVDARGAMLVPGFTDAHVRADTAGGALAGFAEREHGTLEAGKLADFALVDRDLTRVPPDAVRDARVLLTVAGGRVVYEAPGGIPAPPR